MKKDKSTNLKVTRRKFIQVIGASSASLLVNPVLPSKIFAAISNSNTTVATASVSSYDETLLKEAVEQSFAALGGLGDIIKAGDTVGIKINLTGGSAQAESYQNSSGMLAGETYWTNPVLLKVVGQTVKDAGAGKLYILEALYDWESVNNFGYKEVVDYLGATFIDLNYKAPYTDYIQKSVGDNYLIYPDLTLNGIFNELDCFISIPKAKQHATAGVTHGMKNLIGVLPVPSGLYNDGAEHRAAIHNIRLHDGIPNNNLCRVILDINRANPIHLVVNDAVKTVLGSEGPWTGAGITPVNFNTIITGKDPVAVDSVSTDVMGFDPMADDYTEPYFDSLNYLKLASEEELGEYDLSKIEIIDTATGLEKEGDANLISSIQLHQNYPNPFNPSTTIQFSVQKRMNVSLKIFNARGQEIGLLFDGVVPAGSHKLNWNANGLSSGVYICQLRANNIVRTRKLIFTK
jgi:uncharacterized protein (DUF362 family)